jgi:phosphoglycerate kinase
LTKEFLTLDDFDFKGKTTFLRVDINCPLDEKTKKITDISRIRAAAPTIEELIGKGARVVILAHQGRPGDWDFVSLEEHSRKLQEVLGVNVKFVADVCGENAQKAIKGLRNGEILMLENQRFNADEMKEKTALEHSETSCIRNLAPLGDIFVNDAFSAAHRSQCSLVGFTEVMPSTAGRLMESEITSLSRLVNPVKPSIFIFGGAKFADSIKVVDNVLEKGKADQVILVGLTAQAFLKAKGVNLGPPNEKALEKEGTPELYQSAGSVLDKHKDRILLPDDFAIDKEGKRSEITVDKLPTEYPICDIGPDSNERFRKAISKARTIFISGPAGVYEKPQFLKGTSSIMEAIVNSKAFSVAGGGHTTAALELLGLLSKISYVSTAGGALERFVMGKAMPAIEALKASAIKFRRQ